MAGCDERTLNGLDAEIRTLLEAAVNTLREPVMQRRTFLAMVSGGLFAAPLAAEAQQPEKIPQSLLQRADQVIE